MKYVIAGFIVGAVLAAMIIDRTGTLGMIGIAYLVLAAGAIGAFLGPCIPFLRNPQAERLTTHVMGLREHLSQAHRLLEEERKVVAAMTENVGPSDLTNP